MPSEIAQHEPSLAFDGGPFGIKILHSLMKEAPRFLNTNGAIAFEVGLGQGPAIVRRLQKKFSEVQSQTDANGEIRVVTARMP